MKGIIPLASTSAFCLIGATTLAAAYYHDRWQWAMAGAAVLIGGVRVGVILVLASKVNCLTRTSGLLWARSFSVVTLLFCSLMGLITLYNFRYYDEPMQILCVMGTFALCSGISSRLGLQPRVSQACILIMQASLAISLARFPHPLVRCATVLSAVTAFAYCNSIRLQYDVIEEQIRTRRRLRSLANHDSLTGLPNRHYFETAFEEICASQLPFTLWMLDLDGFKELNDTHGHAVGDEMLKKVASRLEHVVRTTDLLARLGGDEFVILQTEVHSNESTRKLAERITAELAVPYQIKGHRIVISASVGIKLVVEGNPSPQQALLEADRALYRVKGTGHGGFEFA